MITRPPVPAFDEAVAAAARSRVDALTKPLGALGRIEDLAVQLAGIAGKIPDRAYARKAVIVAAADHGVVAEGVSAYPQEVTGQMVATFVRGRAAVNAFARGAGADVYIADFGTLHGSPAAANLFDLRVRAGTRNLMREAALTDAEVQAALWAGEVAVEKALQDKAYDVLAFGDMGIGNTTSAAAIVAAFSGLEPAQVIGRGTGVDDAGLDRKRVAIEAGLARMKDRDWETIAREVGGLEILGLAGAMLAGAARRIPIVVDGVIVSAAALLANALSENVKAFFIASHLSLEPGHRVALGLLGLNPLLDLNLRLGEATGAVLALPLIEAASRMICEMQTFEEAGVSSRAE
jgi:nicotinate-nucleotide--dimethylbenzimidazole phosphoribosyltransferase